MTKIFRSLALGARDLSPGCAATSLQHTMRSLERGMNLSRPCTIKAITHRVSVHSV